MTCEAVVALVLLAEEKHKEVDALRKKHEPDWRKKLAKHVTLKTFGPDDAIDVRELWELANLTDHGSDYAFDRVHCEDGLLALVPDHDTERAIADIASRVQRGHAAKSGFHMTLVHDESKSSDELAACSKPIQRAAQTNPIHCRMSGIELWVRIPKTSETLFHTIRLCTF